MKSVIVHIRITTIFLQVLFVSLDIDAQDPSHVKSYDEYIQEKEELIQLRDMNDYEYLQALESQVHLEVGSDLYQSYSMHMVQEISRKMASRTDDCLGGLENIIAEEIETSCNLQGLNDYCIQEKSPEGKLTGTGVLFSPEFQDD